MYNYTEIHDNHKLYGREISFVPFMARRMQIFRDIYFRYKQIIKENSQNTILINALLSALNRDCIHPQLRYEFLETIKLLQRGELFQKIMSDYKMREIFKAAMTRCIEIALDMDTYNQSLAYEIITISADMLCPKKLSENQMYSYSESLSKLLPQIVEKYPKVAKGRKMLLAL